MKQLTSVFFISLALTLAFIIWGAFSPTGMNDAATAVVKFLQVNFGWFYLTAATIFLIFLVYLAFSRYGRIKLGKNTDEPEYSLFSWLAMIFSAGMGMGIVFWGVAEPIHHFHTPPFGKGDTVEAADLAFNYSFFHWGFHAWAIYGVLGLALAYVKFKKNAPQVGSEILRPLFGNKIDGMLGRAVNVIFIIATIFAIAGPLGMGATQISGGLSYLTNIPNNFTIQVIIIGIVTVLFTLSAQSGLQRGLKYLSNATIVLTLLIMVCVFVLGPTTFIMDLFTSMFGSYIQNLPNMSLNQHPFEQTPWFQDWTVFYWAWWIAAAPFAGSFIARISKGRTIREFILGVLIVPTLFCLIWFSVLGGTAVSFEMFNNLGLNDIINKQGVEVALFSMLNELPFGTFMSVMGISLVSMYFITTADASTFVLAAQSTNGSLNPPNSVKLSWGVIQSTSAVVLLWSGGLGAIQSVLVITAFPLTIIMLLTVVSLIKSLRKDETVTQTNNALETEKKVI